MHSDRNSLNPNHPALSTLAIKFSFTIFGLLLTGSMIVSVVAQEQSNTGNLPKIKVETVASHLEIPWSIAFANDGRRIKFGPDERLYIGVGDASDRDSAQDTDMLSGKILRINPDGSIPSDNPFPNSPVYSYGNRNPQGIDWDPITGKLVETEHGPSGEMGVSAHDEINVIEAGKNYGWPKVIGNPNDPSFVDPIFQTGDSTWAPSGATFYSGDKIPEWKGKYLVATLRGAHLEVFRLDVDNNKTVSSESMFDGIYCRLRDVEQSPDGYLYLLTSNRDGRGSPSTDDDRILKIVPDGSSRAVPEFNSSFTVLPIASAFMIALFYTARYIMKRKSTIR